MADKIKILCGCGKSLSADPKLAGRKSKCPSCGQVVQIPAAVAATSTRPNGSSSTPPTKAPQPPKSTAAAPRSSSSATSPIASNPKQASPPPPQDLGDPTLWNDAEFGQAAAVAQPATTLSPRASSKPAGGGVLQKILHPPWWALIVAFPVYCGFFWLASSLSVTAGMLFTALLTLVGALALGVGVCARSAQFAIHNRPSNRFWLFWLIAIPLALIGIRGTSAGVIAGTLTRDMQPGKKKSPSKPLASWPRTSTLFGGLCLIFGLGAFLLVGKLTGSLSYERLPNQPSPLAPPAWAAQDAPPQPSFPSAPAIPGPTVSRGPSRDFAASRRGGPSPLDGPEGLIFTYGPPDREEFVPPTDPREMTPTRVLVYDSEHLRATYKMKPPADRSVGNPWNLINFQDATDRHDVSTDEALERLAARRQNRFPQGLPTQGGG
jgi:hypothetical protein